MKNAIRITSIISYLLIILTGQMIGLPFIAWLIFTTFDFGSIDQFFAILGIIGIILHLTKWRNKIPIMLISFVFMLSPIVSRLIQVPIEMFNYLAFQIPLIIFITTYSAFIFITAKQNASGQNSTFNFR